MRIRSFLPGQGSSGSISARIPAAPFLLLLGACTARPPVAEQRSFVVQSPHGDRVDEYYWLRDDDSEKKRPDIMRYLEAEKAYSEAMTAPLAPLREKLVAELRSRIKEDDATVPAFDRGAWYWTRFEQGAEYPKVYRQKGGAGGPDPNARAELLLDGPALADGEDYFAIGDYSVSDDGRYLAWTQDVGGRRIHTLFIKDLATGEVLPERITPTLESVEWAADSRTLFYMRQDPVLLQSGPVYTHAVGTDPAKDALVYDEPDKTLFAGISASASGEYLLIQLEGFDTNELRAVPRARPRTRARRTAPRGARSCRTAPMRRSTRSSCSTAGSRCRSGSPRIRRSACFLGRAAPASWCRRTKRRSR